MRALVMSIMSLARTVASRSDGWVRTHAASIVGRVRAVVSRTFPARATAVSIVRARRAVVARVGGPAQAGRASIVRFGRAVVARAGGSTQAGRVSIVRFGRAVAARAGGSAQAGRVSIVYLGRAVVARAEGPMQACAAAILRLGRAAESYTEGVRTQVYVAFTLSFLLVFIVGALVFSHGERTYRTAAPLTPQPQAGPGPAAVAPTVDPLPQVPSMALPRLADPSKPAEEAARLLNAAPVGHASAVAVRSSGSARSEVAKVREIALWGNPTKPWVSITASAPVKYQLRNVEPDWVVIDVSKAELALTSGKPPAGRGLVRLIRVGQFTPDTVRVVLELTEAVPVHVATSAGKTAIVVSLAGDARGNSLTEPAPGPRPGVAKPVPAARSASPAAGT